jgi:hypothetical protein
MAQGGFKAFEVEYIRTASPTYQTVLGEMNKIIKGVCVGLCQNAGWENDPDYTPTDDDFVTIGNTPASSSDVAKSGSCHFLKNSSGARLCVAYFYGSSNQTYSTEMFCNSFTGTRYRGKGGGLSISMLPPGYESEAWDITNDCKNATFLPLHAIPFCCLAQQVNNNAASIINKNNGRYIYTIIAKNNDVFFSCRLSGSSSDRHWASIGELFGVLCNETDNTPSSKYCAWYINKDSYVFSEDIGGGLVVGSSSPTYDNFLPYLGITFWNEFVGSFQTWNNQTNTSCFVTNYLASQYNNYTTSVSTGQAAFSALGWALWCANPNTQGVVQGNGFKGYFDTDKVRMVAPAHPLGTLFNDGAFIHIGSGIAIGWDSTNTVNPYA